MCLFKMPSLIVDSNLSASSFGPGSHELGHSNYRGNSKSYYKIFSTTTLDYWKNCHDSFGVTQAQYELRGLLWFRFGRADSIVNDNDIGLSEHLVIMIVLRSHVFSAKFTTVVFRNNDYDQGCT